MAAAHALCRLCLGLATVVLVVHWLRTATECPSAAVYADRTQEFARRAERVRQACQEYGLTSSRQSLSTTSKSRMMVDSERNLSYCATAGNGADWVWQRFFFSRSHGGANEFIGDDVVTGHHVSFTFVTHPLVRLLSVFHDPIRSRALLWRSESRRGFLPSAYDAFPDLSAFAQMLVDGHFDADDDLRPVAHACGLCHGEQDFLVGKEETFFEDTAYLASLRGIRSILKLRKARGPRSSEAAEAALASVLEEYSHVPVSTVRRLIDMYKIDMDMFEYSGEMFLVAAKSEDYSEP